MPIPNDVVVSRSLAVHEAGMNVDPADVDEFIALARAGVIGGHEVANCGAVQNDVGIGRSTRAILRQTILSHSE